jgi:hypothetical protein
MSCESEINPKWKHAIDSNVCPFCGNSIMEEKLRDLLSDLRETIDALLSYPEQLNDWLLSNYNYIKTDSPDLPTYLRSGLIDKFAKETSKNNPQKEVIDNAKFTVKIKNESGEEEEIVAEKIQTEEKTSSFFQRAEAVKPNIDGFKSAAEKTQRLKKMADQIKKAGVTAITSDSNGFISAEMIENADPEAVAEMQGLISEEEANITSSLSVHEDDEIPPVVLAMANRGISKGNSSSNVADLLKLKKMQERIYNSRRNFESGESRGKGGFSRSG